MKYAPAFFLFFVSALLSPPSSSEQNQTFRDLQWKFPRVRRAAAEKDSLLRERFHEKHLPYPPHAILLRAFKKEAVLELWATAAAGQPYGLIHEYRICTSSGVLGPKRRFGDVQVPEGFYELDWFNPQSNFFLSMHINYPNSSDRILGYRQNLGGDIFLHGNCASIGCIPITDDGIKKSIGLLFWFTARGSSISRSKFFPRVSLMTGSDLWPPRIAISPNSFLSGAISRKATTFSRTATARPALPRAPTDPTPSLQDDHPMRMVIPSESASEGSPFYPATIVVLIFRSVDLAQRGALMGD